MADVEVYGADIIDGQVRSLKVRFKGLLERTIDRDTALEWLKEGHALIACAGSWQHPVRGGSIERIEIEEAGYLRTDTQQEPKDHIVFPAAGGHH